MGAIRMCARSIVRRRVWSTVALVLLVGIAGGAVLAAVAGARRTDGAYGRLLESTRAADVLILGQGFGFIDVDAIAELPNVRSTAAIAGFGLATRPEPFGMPTEFPANFSGAAVDGRFVYEIEGARLLEGRLPRKGAVHEIGVSELFVRDSGLGVGDVYRAMIMDFPAFDALGTRLEAEGREPTESEVREVFTPVDLRITGILRSPTDLVTNENQGAAAVLMTPAFARRYRDLVGYQFVAVRLDDPGDTQAFQTAARRALPDEGISLQSAATGAVLFGLATAPYVDALRLFALIAAATALFVVGQAMVRAVGTDADDGPVLASLGVVRHERGAVAAARAIGAAWLGALLAAVVAVLASPIFPIGVARLAEPDPGLRVDGVVIAAGTAAIGLVLTLVTVVAAWRISADRRVVGGRDWRPSAVAAHLAGAGASAPAVTGVRFALQRGRGASAPSLATTLVGLVAAIATLSATIVFAANLDRLVTTPAAYGWGWDALIDTYDSGTSEPVTAKIVGDRDLAGVSIGSRATLEIDGRAVSAFGFESLRGEALPDITEGRRPARPGEVALGAQTRRELGVAIGDSVTARSPAGATTQLEVVGQGVFPSLTLNASGGLNDGAMVTAAGMRALDSAIRPSFYLVDTAPGVTRRDLVSRYGDTVSILGPQRPGEIESYSRVRATPVVLAGLLAVLGIGVLAHVLATSVSARRRELAVLKTLGFTRRQVASSVAWQATTLVLLALVVGIPAGLAAGRWFWQRFSSTLGIADALLVPGLGIALVAVAVIVLANLIALLPARAASRTRPAVVLRSE